MKSRKRGTKLAAFLFWYNFFMGFIRRHLLIFAVIFLALVNIIIWQKVLAEAPEKYLKVYFLNIGQGDATFIEAPNGNQVLIDGGPQDNSVLRELGEVMSVGDRSIDMVLATHPDADHIGGLAEVLNRYNVDFYVESGNRAKDTKTFSNLLNVVDEKTKNEMESIVARSGTRFVLDPERGIFMDILFPDRDVVNTESNNASIVVKLVYGEVCFILTGDAPKKVEDYITSISKDNIDCEVLKVGHHGSRTSSGEKFVEAVSPEYAVISAGKNNNYGHPHKEVLDIFNKFGVEVLRTDQLGRVEIESNGVLIFVNN